MNHQDNIYGVSMMKLTEVGCYLSHATLWERCVREDQPCVIIEDDIFIKSWQRKKIIEAVKSIPSDAHFAALMYSYNPSFNCDKGWCVIDYPEFCGAMMYYITPRGARELIRYAYPAHHPVDNYMGLMGAMPHIHAYHYSERLYPLSKIMEDVFQQYKTSTIGHNLVIKRGLPNSNPFYFVCLGTFTAVCIALAVSVSLHFKKKAN